MSSSKEGVSLVYEVVYCSECQKPVKSVPSWLSDVKVRFTCESCRQKHPKAAAGYDADIALRAARDEDVIEDADILVVADDEEAAEDGAIEPVVEFDEVPEEP
jgi:hypothetical protein